MLIRFQFFFSEFLYSFSLSLSSLFTLHLTLNIQTSSLFTKLESLDALIFFTNNFFCKVNQNTFFGCPVIYFNIVSKTCPSISTFFLITFYVFAYHKVLTYKVQRFIDCYLNKLGTCFNCICLPECLINKTIAFLDTVLIFLYFFSDMM